MELKQAQQIAEGVKNKLSPFCLRLEVAGSIRRERPFVNDIDLVVIPSDQGQFIGTLQSLGKITMGGQKLIRCQMPGITLDVYIATPETWATLLLIRTGSKVHNIRLCTLAKTKGMVLHADGSGLYRSITRTSLFGSYAAEERVADTEASIFEALGLKYREPEERE